MHLIYQYLRRYYIKRLSREKILKIQEKRFRQILTHAYLHSPFYQELYHSHGIKLKDLQDIPHNEIPSITKEDAIQHFDLIVTDRNIKKKTVDAFIQNSKNPLDKYLNKYHVFWTSGSTGISSHHCCTSHELECGLAPHMAEDETPLFARRRIAILVYGGHGANATNSLYLANKFFTLSHVEVISVDAPIATIIEKLNRYQPTILYGYTSLLHYLCYAAGDGQLNISPLEVITTGEPISQQIFEKIKERFRCPVLDLYGSTEFLQMGIGKESYNGIYLYDDNVKVEFYDKHLLCTNLFNFTQPLIRYRVDDHLNPIEDSGRALPFTLVDKVVGRDEQNFYFQGKDGSEEMIFFGNFFALPIEGIENIQYLINGVNQIEVIYIPLAGFERAAIEDSIQKNVTAVFNKYLDPNNFEISLKITPLKRLLIHKRSKKSKFVMEKSDALITAEV